MIEASVVFIINNVGKILILKRCPGDYWQAEKWGLPGGGKDKNESYEDAAVREIKEETGLSIFQPRMVYWLNDNKYSVKYYVARNFFGTVKLDFEHTAYKWVSPQDIIPEECTPNLKDLALKYAVGDREDG